MDKYQMIQLLEALSCLFIMTTSEQTYPHGDCENVVPSFNECYGCPKHSFCLSRENFKECISLLEKQGGG